MRVNVAHPGLVRACTARTLDQTSISLTFPKVLSLHVGDREGPELNAVGRVTVLSIADDGVPEG
jgi:hypothetical protein